jgi:ribonuclease BN (tRNA processing enzyme)
VGAGAETSAAGAAHRLILVHEATFHDTESGRSHAVRKRHSTVAEAVRVGAQMGERGGGVILAAVRFD